LFDVESKFSLPWQQGQYVANFSHIIKLCIGSTAKGLDRRRVRVRQNIAYLVFFAVWRILKCILAINDNTSIYQLNLKCIMHGLV